MTSKMIILLILFINLDATQNYYSNKMFNNSLKVVLPETPELVIETPYIMYVAVDKDEAHTFTIQSQNTAFQYDIGEYKQSVKTDIDDTVKDTIINMNFKILKFSSILSRSKNTYIAIYHIKSNKTGAYKYMSTKYIIYGKKLYKWSVMSNDRNHKIFDAYKEYVKIIK